MLFNEQDMECRIQFSDELKRWIVNNKCVIEDNDELEYEWNWNQFINKWKWWFNEYYIQMMWYESQSIDSSI